ncbi:hypothetical protein B0T20DRAFT_44929 [Sordaria brevicollis]|uniref:Nephrocystin 3-like N-terminal domain-containing protein n=1 Tax=Sordaria brevicollis TaxID=83679 RepID=A0AAE0P9R0_SORBR|nr:hypothetical protein B0T20DRAFT_44929 [Sordaria brevicollis]
MDPLSALSVAAAVVQFVDFGFGLVKKASNIRKDAAGVREKIVEIDRISQELVELSEQIQERMAPLQHPGAQLTVLEMRLLEECKNCQALGGQLAEAIPKIQEKGIRSVNVGGPLGEPKNSGSTVVKDGGSYFSNFRDALQLVLAEGRIVDFEIKLETTKSTLMLTMISCLWERSSRTQRLFPGSSGTTIFETETLGQQLQSDSEQERFESFLHLGSKHIHHKSSGIPALMGQQLSDVDCIETLLHQLNFGSLNTRHEAVPKAYGKTFSWIFEPPKVNENNPDDLLWADFSKWLEDDSIRVYWIAGKPGSGKSTIMIYICADERLMAHLRNWSGSKPLYSAKYFSWNAGDDMQKSQEGLLRSLLYQIIQQAPQVAAQSMGHAQALWR